MTADAGPGSVADRTARGRGARARSPRSGHADWTPAAGRPDPVAVLEEQAATRVPELTPIRYGRMLTSPFAFFRGAAGVMAADLAGTPVSGIRVQLCGDAHLSNFGFASSPERSLVFSVNDFDETLPGPWEWDVKRLAASCAVAARGQGRPAAARRRLVTRAVAAYRGAMREFAAMRDIDVWYARADEATILARWGEALDGGGTRALTRATTRSRRKDSRRAVERLTHRVDGRLRFISDPPLLVPIEDLAAGRAAREIEAAIAVVLRDYRATLQHDRRHLLDGYRYAHLARKVVGVGSVGTRAWVVLLLGRDEADPLVMQVKEATASVLAPHVGRSRFRNEGRRVVEGQRLMQSASDIFLGWHHLERGLDGRPRDFYVRQLWDGKTSADLDRMSPAGLVAYAEVCGWTLARAHARSGDRIAIAAYLGGGDVFDRAIAEFAERYADRNDRDHAALAAAVAEGRVRAAPL